jgi:hypothetical protein
VADDWRLRRLTVARVPYRMEGEVPSEVQAIYDGCTALHGRNVNAVRAMAHAPAVARWLILVTATLQKDGLGCTLDARTRALAQIKVSAVNECRY